MVTGDTAEDAAGRRDALQQRCGTSPGRPFRADQLRVAMSIVDRIAPTPRETWRKIRGQKSTVVTPRREARAVQVLINIFADRGEDLRPANATRIIEAARAINDEVRGISTTDRFNIEEARQLLSHGWEYTERERGILHEAQRVLKQATGMSERDAEFLRRSRDIRFGNSPVH